jgi:hypothetical protein
MEPRIMLKAKTPYRKEGEKNVASEGTIWQLLGNLETYKHTLRHLDMLGWDQVHSRNTDAKDKRKWKSTLWKSVRNQAHAVAK